MIKDIETEIKTLRAEADRLLIELKENPNAYRQIMNKYNAVMGKLRYRTKPEYRDKIISSRYNRIFKEKLLNQQHISV